MPSSATVQSIVNGSLRAANALLLQHSIIRAQLLGVQATNSYVQQKVTWAGVFQSV